MARALAHIERVHSITPIEGADFIELVHVLGWQCVAVKGEFEEGDLAVYIEIDSKVPETEVFEFLRNKQFKVKTQKFRGALSQGLALPLSKFPQLKNCRIGTDVTKQLGIVKIITAEERRLMAEEGGMERAAIARAKARHPKFMNSKFGKWCMKYTWTRHLVLRIFGTPVVKPSGFPGWIKKTDEERIQNCPECLSWPYPVVVTEKLDGTSTTFAIKRKGRKWNFFVCSRNVLQADPNQHNWHTDSNGVNVYWEMAEKYDVRNVLVQVAKSLEAKGKRIETIVLQGETIGDGLQGNPYNLDHHSFYGFNLVVNGKKMPSVMSAHVLAPYGVPWVPILETDFDLPETVDEMLKYADGESVINGVMREGVVIRSSDATLSFKAVSNKFLLKKKND